MASQPATGPGPGSPDASSPPTCYYSTLGLSRNASVSAIRTAYRKLAMKWHPDKCASEARKDANTRFQEIQEAYAVLSDDRKKALYDHGLYDPDDDDEDIEGLSSFISEMAGMMSEVQASQDGGNAGGSSFEDLQQLFVNMFSADIAALSEQNAQSAASTNFHKKRGWTSNGSFSLFDDLDSCARSDGFGTSGSHYFFSNSFEHDNEDCSTSKKKKSSLKGNMTSGLAT